jgi:hypothetical protein
MGIRIWRFVKGRGGMRRAVGVEAEQLRKQLLKGNQEERIGWRNKRWKKRRGTRKGRIGGGGSWGGNGDGGGVAAGPGLRSMGAVEERVRHGGGCGR